MLNDSLNNPQGAGFHTRGLDQQDVEEEIDIDGDDQAIFGEAQFTERDIIPVNEDVGAIDEDVDVDIEGNGVQQEQLRLRELVAVGSLGQAAETRQLKVDETEIAIISARQRGDKAGLILALEVRVTELVSQICCPLVGN